MALSRRSSRGGRSRFTLVLLVLTSVTVLTLDFRGEGVVDDLRGAAATVFGPVREAASWVGQPVSDAWNGVFGYDELRAENEQLRDRIAELERRDAQADDALRRMEALEDLNGISDWTDLESVTARVTGGSLSNFEHTVELDKGSDHGLAIGQPVVTSGGLVGRLVQVTGSRSVVQLVSDPNWQWGVRFGRSGRVGIAHGTGQSDAVVVDEGVALNVDVNRREVVTTSGLAGSIFPPDIPVGRVSQLDVGADQLQQVITVTLLAELDDLSYVRVLQWVGS